MLHPDRLPRTACLLLACAAVAACAELVVPDRSFELFELSPGDYALDPRHTTMLFKVGHLDLSTFVGRFNDLNASLDFDPDAVEETGLEAVVATGSLDIVDDELEQVLRDGGAWLDAQDHPQARFLSRSARRTGENTLEVTGEMTLRGVTRPLVFQVTVVGGGTNLLTGSYTLGFEARAAFNRSDFGMTRFTDLVGDQVTLELYGEFQRQ